MTRPDDDVAGAEAATTPGLGRSTDPVAKEAAGSSRAPAPGERFGRYQILHRVGRGGMGMVFAAHDPDLDRRVALKILRPDRGRSVDGDASDPREDARLLREARAMAQLTHPNVIAVFDVGIHDARPFIAMELVQGDTLSRWLEAPGRTRDEILAAFEDAGRGLAAAHAQGLVHRDFKPSNVLVEPRDTGWRVRVLDFGLVRAAAPSGSAARSGTGPSRPGSADTGAGAAADSKSGGHEVELTDAGMVMGTPVYMSPEQHDGAPVDDRSDQFSFCVALYIALFHQRPFVGLSTGDLGKAKREGELRPPPAASDVPAWLRRVIARGLEADPARRWPDMQSLLAAMSPRRRRARRRRLVVAGIGATAAAAAGIVVASGPGPCERLEAGVEADWTDARRSELMNALRNTGVGFAETSWKRIEADLGTFVEVWTATRSEVCTATLVDGDRDALAFDVAMACLGQQRAQMLETVDIIAQADVDVATRAVSLVGALDDPRTCARETDAPLPPASSEERARVERGRRLIERSSAQLGAAKHDLALASAEEAWTLAQESTYPLLRIEAQYARGRALFASGQLEDAEPELTNAHWAAVEARHDAIAVASAVALANMVGVVAERIDDGMEWARHAQSAIDRAGGNDVGSELRRLETVAQLHRKKGRLDQARGAIDEALALAEQTADLPPLLLVRLHSGSATIAADAGDYARARELYELALAQQTAFLGDDHPNLSETLDGIGRVKFSTDDVAGALETFERSLALREKAFDPEHPAVAVSLTNVAATLRMLNRGKEALEHHQRALGIREKVYGENHPLVAVVLINLASQLYGVGDVDGAIATNQRALSIFENAHGPDHPDVCMVLNNMGILLEADGRYEASLGHHLRALDIRERILPDPHPDRALSLANIARAELHLNKPANALPRARAALAMYETVLGPDSTDAGYALVLVGTALNDLERYAEARPVLERAKVIFDIEANRMLESHERGAFQLARALWETGDRARACELATGVRDVLASWDLTYESDRQAVAAWLGERSSCRDRRSP